MEHVCRRQSGSYPFYDLLEAADEHAGKGSAVDRLCYKHFVSNIIHLKKIKIDGQYVCSRTSICSGIKTSYLSQLANRKDFTWATYDIFVWVTAEFFLVIFCGTLPTLKPILNFIRRYILRVPTSRKVSSRSYQRHTGDESTPQEETALRLSPMRPDGTSSHTVVSTFEEDYHQAGLKDDRNNHITVERTYEVHSQVP